MLSGLALGKDDPIENSAPNEFGRVSNRVGEESLGMPSEGPPASEVLVDKWTGRGGGGCVITPSTDAGGAGGSNGRPCVPRLREVFAPSLRATNVEKSGKGAIAPAAPSVTNVVLVRGGGKRSADA